MTAEGNDPAPPTGPRTSKEPSARPDRDWDSWQHPLDDPNLLHRRIPELTAPVARDSRLSGAAVASLVFGLLGGLLGVIFGIIALRDIKRTGRRGRGLAIAGVTLTGAWAVVGALVLALGTNSFLQVGNRVNAVHDLRPGDCLDLDPPGPGTPYLTDQFSVVPCAQPHNAEYVGRAPGHYDDPAQEYPPSVLPAYPGPGTLARRAGTWCPTLGRDHVLDPLSLPAGTHLRWLLPRESEWNRSGGSINCFLAADGTPFTRPLKMNAATVNAEQLRFLIAIREAAEQLERVKALGRGAPLAELRAAASELAQEQSDRRLQLMLGPWPATAQPAVDRLVQEALAAEPLWRDVSGAADPDQLFERLARAEQHAAPETELAVRRALGLATAPGEPLR